MKQNHLDPQKEIVAFIKKEGLPEQLAPSLIDMCRNYLAISQQKDHLWALFFTFLEKYTENSKNPYHFAYFHKASRSPFDAYQFGLDFVAPLLDQKHSTVQGTDVLQSIPKLLEKKENCILLSNHQTEIDPQIISLLIEKQAPKLAEDMIFVAGHRVTTDPMACPLSFGRNLFCIYSKRYVDSPPEKKEEKLLHNRRTLQVMQELLDQGGICIYVAPSGGRDRANSEGLMEVAHFDPSSVEMFYLLAKHAKRPCHFYTLALKTHELLPPPKGIVQEIGEARLFQFAPAHLSFGPEIEMEKMGGLETISDKKLKRQKRADAIWQKVISDYNQFP